MQWIPKRACARAAACALALAAVLPAAVAAETDLYRVEVIVFSQTGGESGTPERWPLRPEPVAFERYAELRDDARPGETAFRQLDGGELELRSVARRLDDADTYRVLEHTGWVQPGYARDRAPAVPLPVGSQPPQEQDNGDGADQAVTDQDLDDGLELLPRPPEGLSGGMRVWRERYLHVETDFRWLAEREDDAPARRAALKSAVLDDLDPVVVMRQQRRMRSDELHYLDHPRLGLLIRVKPVDEDD